jgi:hypothetical protein
MRLRRSIWFEVEVVVHRLQPWCASALAWEQRHHALDVAAAQEAGTLAQSARDEKQRALETAPAERNAALGPGARALTLGAHLVWRRGWLSCSTSHKDCSAVRFPTRTTSNKMLKLLRFC